MSNVDRLQADLENIIGKLPLPDERQKNVFRQYFEGFKIVFANAAPATILEIGSGFSTYLLAKLAEGTPTKIISVDLDLGRNFRQLIDICHEEQLRDRVEFINGLTCELKELQAFYQPAYLDKFGDTSIKAMLPFLEKYIVLTQDTRKFEQLTKHFGLNPSLRDLVQFLFRNDVFNMDPFLLEVFGFPPEEKFVRENETLFPTFKENILARHQFDAIFFDSGEFSNNIEFLKLKDKIPSGGFALFHDITFPKSFKNFLPCAYIESKKDEWKVLYSDTKTTPQGIMVAQKR